MTKKKQWWHAVKMKEKRKKIIKIKKKNK